MAVIGKEATRDATLGTHELWEDKITYTKFGDCHLHFGSYMRVIPFFLQVSMTATSDEEARGANLGTKERREKTIKQSRLQHTSTHPSRVI